MRRIGPTTDTFVEGMSMRSASNKQAPTAGPRCRGRRLGVGLVTALACGAAAAVVGFDGQTPAGAAAERRPVKKEVTVTRVLDGDTVEIDGRAEPNIRLIGLNAMETGECGAREAKLRLSGLVFDKKVELTARDRNSTTAGPRQRPRRSIKLLNGPTTEADPAAVLVQEGLALWFPSRKEYRKNARYAHLANSAQAKRLGLWNPDGCGAGPAAQLKLTVDWKGVETITIENTGSTPVDLRGWWLRDGLQRCGTDGDTDKAKRGVTFGKNATLRAGKSKVVKVRTARCPDGKRAWAGTRDVFRAPSGAPVHMGGGAYLFDPHGDIRAAHQYGPVEFQFSS